MQSQALAEAIDRRLDPFPVLRVTWQARGLSLGDGVYASLGRSTAAGQVTGIVRPGGWDAIEYGAGLQGGGLVAVKTSVAINDVDGSLLRMLQTYNPRGSIAEMDFAAEGLVEADWEPIFRGVVFDFKREGLATRIFLKTDDAVLRSPVPPPIFTRNEWPSSFNQTIFGTHMPVVMGVHDARLITSRGMIPLVNIRYDIDLGYWWLVSVGKMVEVRRLHFDGHLWDVLEGNGWDVIRAVWGQHLLTIVTIDEGSQPDANAIVSADVEGPDPNGLDAGATITNPVLQLRKILEEYVYRDPPVKQYAGDHPIIDDASWDAAYTFFEDRGYDSAVRFGSDQDEMSAAELIDQFLSAYPWTRIEWTQLGTLAFVIIDPDDVDPDADAWTDLELHHAGGSDVPYEPGDDREVYSHINQPYMWSAQEQKFLNAYESHDIAALARKNLLTIDNPWSQGRFVTV